MGHIHSGNSSGKVNVSSNKSLYITGYETNQDSASLNLTEYHYMAPIIEGSNAAINWYLANPGPKVIKIKSMVLSLSQSGANITTDQAKLLIAKGDGVPTGGTKISPVPLNSSSPKSIASIAYAISTTIFVPGITFTDFTEYSKDYSTVAMWKTNTVYELNLVLNPNECIDINRTGPPGAQVPNFSGVVQWSEC